MEAKTKYILFGSAVALIILAILLNYVSSEFFSFRYGNLIRKIYFKNTLVKAEVVNSREKIELGLAGRKELEKGRGMLFEMSGSDFQRFWMKGMQIPIDIIWIENAKVIGCERNISPQDERIFTSPGKASLVLEVANGFCDRYLVELNDPVKI